MGRMRVTVVSNLELQPSEPCSRRITKIFKLKLDKQGASYHLVSEDTKKFYFEEFKKHFVWDAAINTLVEKAFDFKAKKRYSDFINQHKKLKEKPLFSHKLLWMNGLGCGRALRFSRFPKGIRRIVDVGRRMDQDRPHMFVVQEEQTQKQPTTFQLFLHTHTLGHDGQTFITDKSKDVNDRMLALMEERRAAGAIDVDDDQLFFKVVGGSKRRRIYGMGQADFIHYPNTSSSSSVNQVDIEDRVTQKVSELRLTLESEIRENVTAEIRENIRAEIRASVTAEIRESLTAEIRGSFEERFAQMQAEMTKFLRQQKDK